MTPPKTPGAKRGTIYGTIHSNLVSFTVRAAPLPKKLLDFLQDNLATLKRMDSEQGSNMQENHFVEEDDEYDVQGEIVKKPSTKPEDFWNTFSERCREVGGEWADVADRVWAFGPQRVGSCLLIDSRSDAKSNSYASDLC